MVRALEYLRQTRSLVFVIFPLNEIDHYLFLSRARYHKNHFVLVKGTEYLNRRKRDSLTSPFLQDQTNVFHHLWHKSFQLDLAMKLPSWTLCLSTLNKHEAISTWLQFQRSRMLAGKFLSNLSQVCCYIEQFLVITLFPN